MADEDFDVNAKDDSDEDDNIVEINKVIVFRFMTGENVITHVKYFDLDSGEFFCEKPLVVALTAKPTKTGYFSIFFKLFMPFTLESEYSIPSEIVMTQGTPTASMLKNYETALVTNFYLNDAETSSPDSLGYNTKYDKDILFEDEEDTNDEEKDED